MSKENVIAFMFDFIIEDSRIYEEFRNYASASFDDVQDALIEFRHDCKWEDIVTKEGCVRWKLVKGIITPGGDPFYICPVCNGSGHINGVEMHNDWKYCPKCGTRLEY